MRLDDLNEEMKYPGQSLGGFWKHGWYNLYDTQKAAHALTEDFEFEDTIVGGVSIAQISQTEYKIGSVGAEPGYGPILYYFAMTKGFLSSDIHISTDAQKIWYAFANLERHGKSIKKQISNNEKFPHTNEWKINMYGQVFKYAYTITGPLRVKIISYMKQANVNHQKFLKWSTEFSNHIPNEVETFIIEGVHSYVSSKL